MPKTLPVQGGDQGTWGTKLNAFITQLQDDTNGGINSATGNPNNLTAADIGYTFINTGQRALKKYKGTGTGSSNNDWDNLLDADILFFSYDPNEFFAVGNGSGNLATTGKFQTFNGSTWVDTYTNVTVGTSAPTTGTAGKGSLM
jgi:hypothetical protein